MADRVDWTDSWMIVAGTPNEECVYKFLDMAISELGQCGVANVNDGDEPGRRAHRDTYKNLAKWSRR